MEKAILKIGDTVLWRGNFGSAAPMRAKVVRIERTHRKEDKEGVRVECLDWNWIRTQGAVIDLDNGYWARGEQIAPLPDSDNARGRV